MLIDGDDTQGGTQDSPESGVDAIPIARSDAAGFWARMVAQYGTPERAGEVLADETMRTRRQRADWKKRAEKAEQSAPPEGAVILTGDDAAAWSKLSALVKPAGELAAALERAAETEQRLAQYETERAEAARKATLAEAADLAKYVPDVLDDLLTRRGMALRVVEEDGEPGEDGSPVKVRRPYVRPTDAGDDVAGEPLTDYVTRDLAKYLPALNVSAAPDDSSAAHAGSTASGGSPASGATNTQTQDNGKPGSAPGGTIVFPEQSPSKHRAPATDAATAFLAARAERAKQVPNPLAPRA